MIGVDGESIRVNLSAEAFTFGALDRLVVALLAGGLELAIPEQAGIASVRNLVVHDGSRRDAAHDLAGLAPSHAHELALAKAAGATPAGRGIPAAPGLLGGALGVSSGAGEAAAHDIARALKRSPCRARPSSMGMFTAKREALDPSTLLAPATWARRKRGPVLTRPTWK